MKCVLSRNYRKMEFVNDLHQCDLFSSFIIILFFFLTPQMTWYFMNKNCLHIQNFKFVYAHRFFFSFFHFSLWYCVVFCVDVKSLWKRICFLFLFSVIENVVYEVYALCSDISLFIEMKKKKKNNKRIMYLFFFSFFS